MLHNHSRITTAANCYTKFCDVCDAKVAEGDIVFVGLIDNGTLVSVASCCRRLLHSVFSQSQYWYPPEKSDYTE